VEEEAYSNPCTIVFFAEEKGSSNSLGRRNSSRDTVK